MGELPEYLKEDASYLLCSKCGRKSYGGDEVNSPCLMLQPDGSICEGILQGISNKSVRDKENDN